ncbi:transposase [Streptomyces sp. ISL-10]|nr:transposase [Streptomyces sp. ISL-10]
MRRSRAPPDGRDTRDGPFATKPRLAWEMIAAALETGVKASWVTGDEAYGQDPQLRAPWRHAAPAT